MGATATTEITMSLTDTRANEIWSLTHSLTNTGQTQYDKRQVIVGTSAVTIMSFGASVGAGTFTDNTGLMIVNTDSTNDLYIGLIVSGAKAAYVKLKPGRFHVFWNRSLDVNTSGGAFSAFSDITSITATSSASNIVCEYLIFQ